MIIEPSPTSVSDSLIQAYRCQLDSQSAFFDFNSGWVHNRTRKNVD